MNLKIIKQGLQWYTGSLHEMQILLVALLAALPSIDRN